MGRREVFPTEYSGSFLNENTGLRIPPVGVHNPVSLNDFYNLTPVITGRWFTSCRQQEAL